MDYEGVDDYSAEMDERKRNMSSRDRLIKEQKIGLLNIQIASPLKFPLLWTIFFIVVGLIMQNIHFNTFSLSDFFYSNYGLWLLTFGGATDPSIYSNMSLLMNAISSYWYYFFYTGGLVELGKTGIKYLLGKKN